MLNYRNKSIFRYYDGPFNNNISSKISLEIVNYLYNISKDWNSVCIKNTDTDIIIQLIVNNIECINIINNYLLSINNIKHISYICNNKIYKYLEDYIIHKYVVNNEIYMITLYPNNFTQINFNMMNEIYQYIYNIIMKYKTNDELLCIGDDSGNISLCFNKLYKKIKIYISDKSIESSNENIKLNKIDNIQIMSINLMDDITNDIAIINPSRKGINHKLLSLIKSSDIKYILYMSCKPITLSKDINKLNEYKIIEQQKFDSFSGIDNYMETISLFEKIE